MTSTICTSSGRTFNLLSPYECPILIEDIAHGLSNLCRFTGHTRDFYSVAQHSVWVSRIVPPSDALFGLLHDAAEAYIGDVSTPLKHLLPDYRNIEALVEDAVFAAFGLARGAMPASVKEADQVLLATEKRDLLRCPDAAGWAGIVGIAPLDITIEPMHPVVARNFFMDRFYEITGSACFFRGQS